MKIQRYLFARSTITSIRLPIIRVLMIVLKFFVTISSRVMHDILHNPKQDCY